MSEQNFRDKLPVSPSTKGAEFNPDQFLQNGHSIIHTNLVRKLDENLPGNNGVFSNYEAGPVFLGYVYETLKANNQTTDYATILLTANQLISLEDYPDFKIHEEYRGRIGRYLDQLQMHIEKHPDQYTTEFITQLHTDEELSKLR